MNRHPIAFCYCSSYRGWKQAFIGGLVDAFNQLGYPAVEIDLKQPNDYRHFAKISGVFSLYSLPGLLDLLELFPPLPCVAWDVDHPSLYWKVWSKRMHDWTYAVHDRGNVNYMKESFAGDALFLPSGVCTEHIPLRPWKERDIDVLLVNTIYEYMDIPGDTSLYIRQIAQLACERAVSDPMVPVDVILRSLLSEMGYEELPSFFHYICIRMDMDRMYHLRVKLIKLLDAANIPITIYGKKKTPLDLENLHFNDEVPFQETLNLMSRSKIVLNISPMFNHGIHERVLSAMGAGAVSLTNQSTYAEEQFIDGKDLFFYDWDKLEALPEMINDLLAQDQYLQDVAQAGRENALNNHRWIHRVPLLKKALCLDER